MHVKKRIIAFILVSSVLLLASTNVSTQTQLDMQDAVTELTEAQIRARLREDRQLFPRSISQEVHGQIERESQRARHSIAIFLAICLALLIFLIFPLFEREKGIGEQPLVTRERSVRTGNEARNSRPA